MVSIFEGSIIRTWIYRDERRSKSKHNISLVHDTISGSRYAMLDFEEIENSAGTSTAMMSTSGHRLFFKVGNEPAYIEIKMNGWTTFEYTCAVNDQCLIECTKEIVSRNDETFRISILETVHTFENDNKIAWYSVACTRLEDGASTVVHRRFREFIELQSNIRKCFKGHHLLSSLPEPPEKVLKMTTDHLDPGFLKDRRSKLEHYLNSLSDIPHVPDLPDFRNFVGIWMKKRERSVVFYTPRLMLTIAPPEIRSDASSTTITTHRYPAVVSISSSSGASSRERVSLGSNDPASNTLGSGGAMGTAATVVSTIAPVTTAAVSSVTPGAGLYPASSGTGGNDYSSSVSSIPSQGGFSSSSDPNLALGALPDENQNAAKLELAQGDALSRINGEPTNNKGFKDVVNKIFSVSRPVIVHFVQALQPTAPKPSTLSSTQPISDTNVSNRPLSSHDSYGNYDTNNSSSYYNSRGASAVSNGVDEPAAMLAPTIVFSQSSDGSIKCSQEYNARYALDNGGSVSRYDDDTESGDGSASSRQEERDPTLDKRAAYGSSYHSPSSYRPNNNNSTVGDFTPISTENGGAVPLAVAIPIYTNPGMVATNSNSSTSDQIDKRQSYGSSGAHISTLAPTSTPVFNALNPSSSAASAGAAAQPFEHGMRGSISPDPDLAMQTRFRLPRSEPVPVQALAQPVAPVAPVLMSPHTNDNNNSSQSRFHNPESGNASPHVGRLAVVEAAPTRANSLQQRTSSSFASLVQEPVSNNSAGSRPLLTSGSAVTTTTTVRSSGGRSYQGTYNRAIFEDESS